MAQDELSRRTVLRRSAILSTSLGLGVVATTGQAAAMNKPEPIEAMARHAGPSKSDAKRALDAFTSAATNASQKGDSAVLTGFGSFSISKRSARTGRNPSSRNGPADDSPVTFDACPEFAAALDLNSGKGDEASAECRDADVVIDAAISETIVLDFGVSQSAVRSLLGWFYSAYSLVGAGLSYYTGAIRARLRLRTWFLWLPFVVGGALVGMYFVPVLALPTFLLIRGLSDVTRSFAGQYVHDRVETAGRATVLSAMAMVSGLAVVPFQLGSGVSSDAVSPLFALAAAGVVLIVGSIGVLLWEAPIEG